MARKHIWIMPRFGVLLLLCLFYGSASGYPLSDGPFPARNDQPPTITLTAVGDIVMHQSVIQSGYDPVRRTYDFRPIFAAIRPLLTQADLSVAVLESPLSGPERRYSGYPGFNSPYAIADAVQWAGVKLVFTAHNHALDQGGQGVLKTLAYYDRIGLRHTGSSSAPGQPRFQLIDCRGIRLAFLACTASTNGIPTPAGRDWLVDRLDLPRIAGDIAAAKKAGADAIVLALHSGVEYRRFPDRAKRQLFGRLLAMGVDILLGSHVHVIEPLEWQEIVAPDGRRRTCFIAYSLGNLLSNQRWRYSDCGLAVTLRLRKDPRYSHRIQILQVSRAPLWVRRTLRDGRYQYLIQKLDGPKTAMATAVPALSLNERARLREVWYDTEELLNGWPVVEAGR